MKFTRIQNKSTKNHITVRLGFSTHRHINGQKKHLKAIIKDDIHKLWQDKFDKGEKGMNSRGNI